MKKLATALLAITLLLPLNGCATFDFLTTPVNELYPDLPSRVTDLKATLTLVKTGWAIYAERPLCGSPKAVAAPKKKCSDWVVVQKGTAADLGSRAAVKAAEDNASNSAIVALQNSIGEFRKITEVVSPKPIPAVVTPE